MMWGNYSMGYWGWGVGALVIVALVVAGILIVRYATVRGVATPLVGKTDAITPRQILDNRLAQGELSVTEYRDRIAALESPQG
jgi:uncharacterized membrane protein